jgi:DNA polymerase-3 subunit gamma/tau
VQLVQYAPGKLEFCPGRHAPSDLAARLTHSLQQWTGMRWVIALNIHAACETTLLAKREEAAEKRKIDLAEHPVVKAVLTQFPGASIAKISDTKE